MISDYAKARQLLGIEAPSALLGSGAVAEYLLTLALGPVADASTTPPTRRPPMGMQDSSFGTRAPYDVDAWKTAFGFGG